MHKFYHADRGASLSENQEILLDENQLSRFGAAYWPAISERKIHKMDEAQLREFYLEEVRKKPLFLNYASRLQSIFAANSLADAIYFAETISPVPENPIPIIEIYADRFWSLDMNWLDYKCSYVQALTYYEKYWYAEISNHSPTQGERKPPRLEVLIALPAKTGRIVHYVNRSES